MQIDLTPASCQILSLECLSDSFILQQLTCTRIVYMYVISLAVVVSVTFCNKPNVDLKSSQVLANESTTVIVKFHSSIFKMFIPYFHQIGMMIQ